MGAEFDLFSGRPNPGWILTDGESAELAKRLKTLPMAKQGAIRDGLGYRGIIITASSDEAADFTRIVVSAGVVLVRDLGGTERLFADSGRVLERWLVETAQGRVDPEILALIDQEIRH